MRKCLLGCLAALFLLLLTLPAMAQEAEDITRKCKVKSSGTIFKYTQMMDGKYTNYWETNEARHNFLTLTAPAGKPIHGLYLCFRYMPDEYEDTEQLLNSIITVNVDARELNDPANSAMPLPPGETARAVEVKGMDNALVIDSENGASIRMRKQMSESLEYKSIDWWNPEDGLLIGTHSFGEYFIQVGSVSVPEEVLMGIFSD